MKKTIILTLLAALVINVTTGTAALAYDAANLNRHESHMMSVLDAEKKKAATAILTETDARIIPLREKLMTKHLELDALSRNPSTSAKNISALAADVSATDAQLRKELDSREQRLVEATGFARGQGYGRGEGRNYGDGMGQGYGRGYGRGNGRSYGDGMGQGYGRGEGRNHSMNRAHRGGMGRGTAYGAPDCIYR